MHSIFEQTFNNQEEVDIYLLNLYNFKKITIEEQQNWPYKNKPIISPTELIGRKAYDKENNFIGIIDRVSYEKNRNHKSIVCYTKENIKLSLSTLYVSFKDLIKEEEIIVSVHPSRKGLIFWEKGFIVDGNYMKKIYYSTKGYRDKYENSLNENNGTEGMRAPIQIEGIKQKITDTIFEKYGVETFLHRGSHYKKIEDSMIEKYGVKNVFDSTEWQMKMNKSKLKKHTKISDDSKIEKEIIEILNEEFYHENNYYHDSKRGQYYIKSNNESDKKFFKLDFYNPNKNLVIEVMGDYWHCNPETYNPEYYHQITKKTAEEIWKDDLFKKVITEKKLNCFYYYIWEKDWKEDMEGVLEDLQNKIKEWEQLK